VVDEQLAIPKELGGPGGDATNPEQLFAAGYAACFNSALALVARQAKVDMPTSAVTARVGIGPQGGGFGLTVSLIVDIPGVARDIAEDLAAKAHTVCPYSNATRGNIEVELRVA
jgi:Ohr subfamily peroxiredoxin